MKHSCYSKYIWPLLLIGSTLFGSLSDKSAIIYYGDKISYPMVGIHDYIIVQPTLTNVYTHGFDVYKDKMYAYVSVGEIDKNIKEYAKVKKSWILTKNSTWGSDVLDLTNPEYQEFFFKEMIEPQMKRGFKNFFFDTLDSYQLVKQSPAQMEKSKAALAFIINTFHKRYPDSKLVINRGFGIIDRIYKSVNAVLFESYYRGLNAKLEYKKMSDNDREWLDIQIAKIKAHNLDVICVDYVDPNDPKLAKEVVKKIKKKGMIPYVGDKDLTGYGTSSKNAVKREILTLIDESTKDRIELGAHQNGALPLEYAGYIQKLYDVSSHPLPSMKAMSEYGGVVIWLTHDYEEPEALIEWIKQLQTRGIKVVFASNFGIEDLSLLEDLGINAKDLPPSQNNTLVSKDSMIGYEIDISLSLMTSYLTIDNGKPLVTLEDQQHNKSTLAAIMPWGGYAVDAAFMTNITNDNIWIINPFEFFIKALRLKKIPVPDATTAYGKRMLYSHVDGDGIMNKVEWDTKLYSGNTILDDILKRYKIPLSISVIGAEIGEDGLYPKIAPQLQKIVKGFYKIKNVEPATHTFTHPFFWGKIKNGNLDAKYRLKPKGYKFSLDRELNKTIDNYQHRYSPKGKKPLARMVFWSGDCAPTEKTLAYIYKNKILNINGGDTYISNSFPWLSYVAPMGLERGEYYQIYTGEQNENMYTNEWLGPFWGFKRVLQTFHLTNTPRRLKPVDIYYHLYSGSKRASLHALQYVYDWSLKQDFFPLFTSKYIPKVMDYYTVSMARNKERFLFSGMKDIKTIRVEIKDDGLDFQTSKNILGYKHFENHTYYHVGKPTTALLQTSKQTKPKRAYLVSANAEPKINEWTPKRIDLDFKGYIPLKLEMYLPKNCTLQTNPRVKLKHTTPTRVKIEYKKSTQAHVDVRCKL